jgi:ribosomal protein S4E
MIRKVIRLMTKSDSNQKLKDGARCKVTGGTHIGKSGIVRDMKTSKTGHVTITVLQDNGERFKTLAKNVAIIT